MKISVIDLGFNSLKLGSYEVRRDNSTFVAYDQESVPARLGEGLNQTGFLGSEPVRRAIEGLKFFKEINELYGIRHCLPVATSAVREAANRDQFLKQVYEETGFKFRPLSGKEEALFSYSGAARALCETNILFFDIGGGSLEFVCSDGKSIKKILSLPLGGLRLTQLYADEDGAFRNKSYSRMETRIMDLLPTRQELMIGNEKLMLVGVGGNLRALARWDQNLRDYPLNKIHNYTIRRESVETMCRELAYLTKNEIAQIDVIGRDRAETIAAGSLVIECTMRKLGFRRVTVSTHGLREGVLASFLDDPVGYHRGKVVNTSIRPQLKASVEGNFDHGIHNFLEVVKNYDLLDERETKTVLFGLKWLASEEGSSLGPDSLFGLMMDEDSPLSHRDQLLGALSVIELRKARSAEWLYSKYKSILKSKSRETMSRLAAVARFLEIVVRTESKVKVSFEDRASKIAVHVLTGTHEHQFPSKILQESISELGNELDRFIEYKVKSAHKSSEYEADRVTEAQARGGLDTKSEDKEQQQQQQSPAPSSYGS